MPLTESGSSLRWICAALAASAAVAPGVAQTIHVPADQPTIQAGIDAAVAGEEVVVAPGTYVENIDFLGKAITVRSSDPSDPAVVASTVIDGGGAGTVVVCASGEGPDTVLSGFVITGGNGAQGGGMRSVASAPTVRLCTFRNNASSFAGGGMYNDRSSALVQLCVLDSNTADDGAGMFVEAGAPVVTGCTFTGNVTAGGGGGLWSQSSALTLAGCTIRDNTAGPVGRGGGLLVTGSASNVDVTGCAFRANVGGGVRHLGGAAAFDACSFTGNSLDRLGGGLYVDHSAAATLSGCTFTGNKASFGGGAWIHSDDTTLVDCVFIGNTASHRGGGALLHASSADHGIVVTGCRFDRNLARRAGGGGIAVQGGTLNMTACTFRENVADAGAGARVVASGTMTVALCRFERNRAVGSSSSLAWGGGISCAGIGEIRDTTFADNTALRAGGIYINNATLTARRCTVRGNAAPGGGGGIRWSSLGSLALADSIVCGNSPDQIVAPWTDLGGNHVADDCCPDIGTRYCTPAVINTTGHPGEIRACGSDVATLDLFELTASQIPPNQVGYFLASETSGFVPTPGGSQGNLCVVGNVGRFTSQAQDSGPAGELAITVDLTGVPTNPPRAVVAGATWHFTAWFRELHPAPTSNFTDAVSVVFR